MMRFSSAAASTFTSGLRAGTTYAGYKTPALAAIRSATPIFAEKAPAEPVYLPPTVGAMDAVSTAIGVRNELGEELGVEATTFGKHRGELGCQPTRERPPT
jgi:hypothetical protein